MKCHESSAQSSLQLVLYPTFTGSTLPLPHAMNTGNDNNKSNTKAYGGTHHEKCPFRTRRFKPFHLHDDLTSREGNRTLLVVACAVCPSTQACWCCPKSGHKAQHWNYCKSVRVSTLARAHTDERGTCAPAHQLGMHTPLHS